MLTLQEGTTVLGLREEKKNKKKHVKVLKHLNHTALIICTVSINYMYITLEQLCTVSINYMYITLEQLGTV